MVRVAFEFSGGLELLFGQKKTIQADVPTPSGDDGELTVAAIILWMRDNLLTDRPELFMKGDTVRPGILVLVNDVDWELSGTLKSPVREGDRVAFISTLHGG